MCSPLFEPWDAAEIHCVIDMVALVQTVAYLGLEARGVEVQCQVAPGLPAFNVVGLPDKAVGESRERVRGRHSLYGIVPAAQTDHN